MRAFEFKTNEIVNLLALHCLPTVCSTFTSGYTTIPIDNVARYCHNLHVSTYTLHLPLSMLLNNDCRGLDVICLVHYNSF